MRKGKLMKLAALSAAAIMAFSSMTVSAEEIIYVTQKGDNLSKIAQNIYGDKTRWRDIYEANRDTIKDPNLIWVNQQLVIPDVVSENPQPVIPQDTPEQWPETSLEWQAAEAAGQSYVEENGLSFYQGTTFLTQGYRYDPDNLDRYEFTDVNGAINSITIRDAEKEGYQVVTISISRSGYIADYDWGEDELLWLTVPGTSLCDIYTGKLLPSANTSGDVELVNSAALEWGGISYGIDYITEMNWTWGDWSEWYDDGSSYCLGTANSTLTVVIPKGYDGLALRVIPSTAGPSSDKEYNVFDNEEEAYIMDNWKEGSILMRVSDLYNILNAR